MQPTPNTPPTPPVGDPGPWSAPPQRRRRRGLWWLLPLLVLLGLVLLILLLAKGCSGNDSVSGDKILSAARAGNLADLVGKDADVKGARVQSVVNETGFWYGTGEDDRVFVEVESPESSPIDVKEGDTVAFTGVIEKNLEAETYGLRANNGAALFRQQGYHVQVQRKDLKSST